MSYSYEDELLERSYEAMEEFAEEKIRENSLSAVRNYLGTYGDAIKQRVKQNVDTAHALLQNGFASSALVHAATAIELTVRFLLVRPLVQGAFLSDEWAAVLAARIGTGRTAEDREILPRLLKIWKIDVDSLKLTDGKPLWTTIITEVFRTRDRVVHQGEMVSSAVANTALECCESLTVNVAGKIAIELGFTLERTGKWSEIHNIRDNPFGSGVTESQCNFKPASPFHKKPA